MLRGSLLLSLLIVGCALDDVGDIEQPHHDPMLPASEPAQAAQSPMPSSTAPAGAASVQFMITNQMKLQLRELGYSDIEIRSLAPERARAIITHGLRRSSKGVPKKWQRSSNGNVGGNAFGGVVKAFQVAAGPVAMAYALYACNPEAVDEAIACVQSWAQGALRRLGVQPRSSRRRAVRRRGK